MNIQYENVCGLKIRPVHGSIIENIGGMTVELDHTTYYDSQHLEELIIDPAKVLRTIRTLTPYQYHPLAHL